MDQYQMVNGGVIFKIKAFDISRDWKRFNSLHTKFDGNCHKNRKKNQQLRPFIFYTFFVCLIKRSPSFKRGTFQKKVNFKQNDVSLDRGLEK